MAVKMRIQGSIILLTLFSSISVYAFQEYRCVASRTEVVHFKNVFTGAEEVTTGFGHHLHRLLFEVHKPTMKPRTRPFEVLHGDALQKLFFK